MGEIFSTLFQIQIKKIKNCVSIKRVLERENKKFNFKRKKKKKKIVYLFIYFKEFSIFFTVSCVGKKNLKLSCMIQNPISKRPPTCVHYNLKNIENDPCFKGFAVLRCF